MRKAEERELRFDL